MGRSAAQKGNNSQKIWPEACRSGTSRMRVRMVRGRCCLPFFLLTVYTIGADATVREAAARSSPSAHQPRPLAVPSRVRCRGPLQAKRAAARSSPFPNQDGGNVLSSVRSGVPRTRRPWRSREKARSRFRRTPRFGHTCPKGLEVPPLRHSKCEFLFGIVHGNFVTT